MIDAPIRVALAETLDGLVLMIPATTEPTDARTSWQNLRWMATQALDHVNLWPVDKTSRWIGFIQGVLATRGYLDVDAERDRTRPLFHKAYEAVGYRIPETSQL